MRQTQEIVNAKYRPPELHSSTLFDEENFAGDKFLRNKSRDQPSLSPKHTVDLRCIDFAHREQRYTFKKHPHRIYP